MANLNSSFDHGQAKQDPRGFGQLKSSVVSGGTCGIMEFRNMQFNQNIFRKYNNRQWISPKTLHTQDLRTLQDEMQVHQTLEAHPSKNFFLRGMRGPILNPPHDPVVPVSMAGDNAADSLSHSAADYIVSVQNTRQMQSARNPR